MKALNVVESPALEVQDIGWLRDVLPEERTLVARHKTGDLLPDGSVLLREEDMDRMGLESLRHWIYERVVVDHAKIVVQADRALMTTRRSV